MKKTSTWYRWANESWWWGGGWNFNPQNTWTVWQVLTKTSTGYDWETLATGEWNVKLFTINSLSDTTNWQLVVDWALAWKMPIIKYNNWVLDVYYCLASHNTTTHTLMFKVYMWPWQSSTWYTFQVFEQVNITYNGTTVDEIAWHKEELWKYWEWTQTQYSQLTPESWVIYNILPNS